MACDYNHIKGNLAAGPTSQSCKYRWILQIVKATQGDLPDSNIIYFKIKDRKLVDIQMKSKQPQAAKPMVKEVGS